MVDWTKPIQFRNAPTITNLRFVARIKGPCPVVVAFTTARNPEIEYLSATYREDGRVNPNVDCGGDVINKPEETVVYCDVTVNGYVGPARPTPMKYYYYDTHVGFVKLTLTDGKLTKAEIVND